MLTVAHLRPVIDLVEAAEGDTAIEALGALRAMALRPEVRAEVAHTLTTLVDDPRFAHRRAELYPLLADVPGVVYRLVELAGDPAAPGHGDALQALAALRPDEWAPDYARDLAARVPAEPWLAERLAALPLERCGLTPADLAAALDHEDPRVRLYGAIAAARLGERQHLDAILDAIAAGDLPEYTYGSPYALWEELAAVRPLPGDLEAALAARAPEGDGPYAVMVWALSGTADAEGTPLAGGASGSTPGVPPPPGTPEERAALVHDRVAEIARAAEPDVAGGLANRLMGLVVALPRPLPLDVPAIVAAWRRSPGLPEDQLASVLGLADDETLLAAFEPDLRSGDPDRSRDAAALLHRAVGARLLWPAIHGDGPAPGRRDDLQAFNPERAAADDVPRTYAEPPVPPPEPEVRRLQANVTEQATGRRREHAFAPGTTHVVGVRIAPGEEGALSVTFDSSGVTYDTPVGAILEVHLIAEGPAGTTTGKQPLVLPPTGPSAEAQLPLDVPATATEVTCTVLVTQGARLLQSVRITGPVAAADEPVGGASIAFVRDGDLASPGQRTTDVDASLSLHVGGAGRALRVGPDGDARLVELGGLAAFADAVYTQLLQASNVDGDDPAAGGPGSDQQVELLRELARHGSLLYQELRDQLGNATVTNAIQVNGRAGDDLPVEFAYDYGYPAPDATLAGHWLDALATGACDCVPRDGKVGVVCPLGFWGVRLVVERNVLGSGEDATTPAAGHAGPGRVLRDLDRVLFAASDNVRANDRDHAVAALTALLGDRCLAVSSWDDWVIAIGTHRPGLLLSMPHNATEADNQHALEIGAGDSLEIGAVTDDHVHPPGESVGPVVMLLGCDTARDDVPWQRAVAAFRRRGASVVVGTLVQTLGRQTAPMAELVADAIWGADAVAEGTIGEVIRAVRRRLVARGWTLGMSLVVYGDAGWRVRPEVA